MENLKLIGMWLFSLVANLTSISLTAFGLVSSITTKYYMLTPFFAFLLLLAVVLLIITTIIFIRERKKLKLSSNYGSEINE